MPGKTYGPRHRDNVDSFQQSHLVGTTFSGSPLSNFYWTNLNSYQLMDDVVTENFYRLQAKGKIINTPASRSDIFFASTPFDYRATQKSNPSNGFTVTNYAVHLILEGYPYLRDGYGFVAVDESNLAELAKQNALAKIDKTPYTFIEDLLEIRKTVDLLKDPLGTLKDIGRNLEKATSKNLTRRSVQKSELPSEFLRLVKNGTKDELAYAKAFASSWLGVKYVYGTTLYSIEQIHEAILDSKIFTYNVPDARRKSTGKQTRNSKFAGIVKYHESGPGDEIYVNWVEESTVEVSAGIMYVVHKPAVPLAYATGTRLKDIPYGLYQIMPYSWALDRVYNISNTIQGLVNITDPNISIVNAWTKTSRNWTRTRQVASFLNNNYTITIGSGGPELRNESSWSRTPWTPTVSDTRPTFDLNFLRSSATSVVDLLALGINFLTGNKSRGIR